MLRSPVDKVTPQLCADLHTRLTNRCGPSAANGSLRTLKAVLNHQARTLDLPPNPVTRGVRMNPERPRDWSIAPEKLGWSEAAVIRYMLRQAFDLQRGGIGDLARRLISEGKTNAATLEAVKAEFPDASTSPESIAWYRSQMRREGLDVLTDREARNA